MSNREYNLVSVSLGCIEAIRAKCEVISQYPLRAIVACNSNKFGHQLNWLIMHR